MITALIAEIKKWESIAFAVIVSLVIGFIVGTVLMHDIVKTKYENKILTMKDEAQQSLVVANEKLIKQERDNASITASLNAKAERLSAEKDKVVVS